MLSLALLLAVIVSMPLSSFAVMELTSIEEDISKRRSRDLELKSL